MCVIYHNGNYNQFKIFLCFKLPQIPWLKLLLPATVDQIWEMLAISDKMTLVQAIARKKGMVTRSP